MILRILRKGEFLVAIRIIVGFWRKRLLLLLRWLILFKMLELNPSRSD